jgi:hypothetical protein
MVTILLKERKMAIKLTRAVFSEKHERSFWTVFTGLTMGMFTILLILWNRLIRERLPREINGELYSVQFWIVLFLFLISLLPLLLYLHKLQKRLRGIEKVNPIFLRFLNYLSSKPHIIDAFKFIDNYFIHAPQYLWRFLYFNLPRKYKSNVLNWIYRLGRFIWLQCFPQHSNYVFRQVLTTIMFLYIPKILVFSVFCYEIVIYKKLELFYYCAPMLLIPVIFLSLRRILLDVSYYERKELLEFVLKIDSVEKDEDGNIIHYHFSKRSPMVSDEDYDLASQNVVDLLEIEKTIGIFFDITQAYDYIVSVLVKILLMLSFLIWLLIILQVY